jgi:predicted MPP superfamily phosphohydrolase
MPLFFIVFFAVYGGVHVYTFLKARAAIQFGTVPGIVIALFMVAMTLAPFFIRMSEKYGLETVARMLSYLGYSWLGILFLFFSASLTLDFYRLCIKAAEFILRLDFVQLRPAAGVQFFGPLFISLLIAAYGYFEALNIRTEKIIVYSDKITQATGRVRIVQISDLHLGLIIREERLRRVLQAVKDAEPDILVSTGDLVDGQINGMSGLSEMLKDIKPRFGKFAITGNHEYYAGLEQALAFTRKSGFKILRNESVDIGGFLNIAGVDDRAVRPWAVIGDGAEKEMLSRLSQERFTLLLKHRPLIDKDSLGLFDLQLSGHVHRGQIFPFSILTKLYYPVHAGFAGLDHGSRLYVSRGTGTWGPPIRFLSPPEITVIDLVRNSEG